MTMDKSLKVRQALAMAIDRETIAELIVFGFGQPHYMGGIWMDDPIFKEHEDEWTIPYDPDKARALMEEAGYSDGFDINVWTGATGFGLEIWEAVGNFWLTELNVKPVFDRADYTQFRPSIVARTSKQLFSGCCYGDALWPNEWTTNSVNDPGGYNVGMEVDVSFKTMTIKNKSADADERKAAAVEILQFYNDWMLWPGVVQWPQGPMYDPTAMEWEQSRPYHWERIGGLRAFEYIKLLK